MNGQYIRKTFLTLTLICSASFPTMLFGGGACNVAKFVSSATPFIESQNHKIIVLGRHGKGSQENKFTAKERAEDPQKVELDILRPLTKKGMKDAGKMADLLSKLPIGKYAVWGSHAIRVTDAAKLAIARISGRAVREPFFNKELYYHPSLSSYMREQLTKAENNEVEQAFFWGHGKTTMELVYALSEITEAFNPTSGIIMLAVEAKDWQTVFANRHESIRVFAWSPKGSHKIEGAPYNEGPALESALESFHATEGLESVGGFENFQLESVDGNSESFEDGVFIDTKVSGFRF